MGVIKEGVLTEAGSIIRTLTVSKTSLASRLVLEGTSGNYCKQFNGTEECSHVQDIC